MDGNIVTNQQIVNAGQEMLLRIEKDLAGLETLLDPISDPFEDRKCNRRFKRLKRRLTSISNGVQDWHEDIEECVSTGDPTVQFGGK